MVCPCQSNKLQEYLQEPIQDPIRYDYPYHDPLLMQEYMQETSQEYMQEPIRYDYPYHDPLLYPMQDTGIKSLACIYSSDIQISTINGAGISTSSKLTAGSNIVEGHVAFLSGLWYNAAMPLRLQVHVGNTVIYDHTYWTTGGLGTGINWSYTFTVPDKINSVDTIGMPVVLELTTAGDGGNICGSQRLSTDYPSLAGLSVATGGVSLHIPQSTVHTGESLFFIGSYLPNTPLNIYYWTKEFGATWREHVTGIQTDANGNFEGITILPSDIKDANGQDFSISTILEFEACAPPGGYGCECGTPFNLCTADKRSGRIPITVVKAAPIIGPAPGTYTRTYPETNTYSGNAKRDHIEIKTLKYFSVDDTRPISQEEALDNILMGIESGAIKNSTPLLKVEVSYTDGNITELYYTFDIKITYHEQQPLPGYIGGYVGMTFIQSLALPLVPIAIGIIVIIGLYILWRVVEATIDLIYGPGASKCPDYTTQQECEAGGCQWKDGVCSAKPSALAGGLGMLLLGAGALLLLSAGGKAVSAVKTAAPKYIEAAKTAISK